MCPFDSQASPCSPQTIFFISVPSNGQDPLSLHIYKYGGGGVYKRGLALSPRPLSPTVTTLSTPSTIALATPAPNFKPQPFPPELHLDSTQPEPEPTPLPPPAIPLQQPPRPPERLHKPQQPPSKPPSGPPQPTPQPRRVSRVVRTHSVHGGVHEHCNGIDVRIPKAGFGIRVPSFQPLPPPDPPAQHSPQPSPLLGSSRKPKRHQLPDQVQGLASSLMMICAS
jgi:hypothetical protein